MKILIKELNTYTSTTREQFFCNELDMNAKLNDINYVVNEKTLTSIKNGNVVLTNKGEVFDAIRVTVSDMNNLYTVKEPYVYNQFKSMKQ